MVFSFPDSFFHHPFKWHPEKKQAKHTHNISSWPHKFVQKEAFCGRWFWAFSVVGVILTSASAQLAVCNPPRLSQPIRKILPVAQTSCAFCSHPSPMKRLRPRLGVFQQPLQLGCWEALMAIRCQGHGKTSKILLLVSGSRLRNIFPVQNNTLTHCWVY